ncbi:selenide, water dikinase SelD [Desulfitobacterium sp. Sab5]|uniref:selenide, water dikinase SelD n=1 Tax=Desulfitobacterium nosdiversum TaxID=3375356 RepID=UPI003CF60239
MGPGDLSEILKYLPKSGPAELLAGMEDDAAAFRIDNNLAVVQTVDFITPIVNDPRTFGAIAAANALSDIYAMGAAPIFALNIVSFQIKSMSSEILGSILAGGSEKVGEAGISIVGGHSVDDPIPKYGLSVTGLVKPQNLIRKQGAQVGDVLILTKPLGTGILANGLDAGIAEEKIEEVMIQVMLKLNKEAAQLMSLFNVHACTDVSGFGLLGHLREMLGSNLTAVISYEHVPILHQVWDILKYGGISSGTHSNARYLRDEVKWDGILTTQQQLVLFDSQTSGGLLIALPEDEAKDLLAKLLEVGTIDTAVIGYIENRKTVPIKVKA